MNRRGFLKAILASATAPYVITTAGVLMPVKTLVTPAWIHAGTDVGRWSSTGEIAAYTRHAGGTILTLEELISASLRSRAEDLARNIQTDNVLLKQLYRGRS